MRRIGGCVPNTTDSRLRVEVLGPLCAWLDDRELALGPARQRAVFAVLAASANRVVSRDELISAVWGASPPATASGSVHTYISRLRRSLEPDRARWSAGDILSSVSAGYFLRLGGAALDAGNFTPLRPDAPHRPAEGDREGAVAALDEALGMWHGDAFAGLVGPFVEQEGRRLAEMRLATIEQRARILLELGGHGELVAELGGRV